MNQAGFESVFVSAQDGLRLHYRDYHRVSSALPIVCLPGLARTSADFHRLASALAAQPRRVLALDYRGRGSSARDPDPTHYDVRIESADVLAVMTAAEIAKAVFVGTSRGGLITMIIATLRPNLVAGAVLNDIGPVIEAAGLKRIQGYIGQLPQPRSWDEAVSILKGLAGAQFTSLSDDDWLDFAQSTFRQTGSALEMAYDPALMQNLKAMDADALPTLWPQFEALGHAPVLVVRGENTDLLSTNTVAEMQARHHDCDLFTVMGQGHAPLLSDLLTIARIREFVALCDDRRTGSTILPD